MIISNVSVIGNGLMGNTIAQAFASAADINVRVWYFEPSENLYAPIEKDLDQLEANRVISTLQKAGILSRISFTPDLKTAAEKADFIIECIPEDMALKQRMLCSLEGYCRPDTILATNTSVMSPTEISEKCIHRERVVGAHFWNPGHLIPLVEVVKSDFTTDAVIDATMELLTKVGKKPIYCKKDVPGFVANRLQHALWREAIYMVENGIADAKTVDDACKYGPGLRWPVMGPMENSDLVGIQLTYNIHNYILKSLADNHEPSYLLQDMLSRGELGMKSGKGWQEWTEDEVAAAHTNLRKHLIDYNASQRASDKN